jgi:hypothetical protein
MTKRNVDLLGLVGNALETEHGDVLREMLTETLRVFMDAEVTELCGAEPGAPPAPRRTPSRRSQRFNLFERAAQHASCQPATTREQQPSRPGHREHELAHRDVRDQRLGPAPRALGDAEAAARRAEPAGLAGVRDDAAVVAVRVGEPSEATGRVAAGQRAVYLGRHEAGEAPVGVGERRLERVPASAHEGLERPDAGVRAVERARRARPARSPLFSCEHGVGFGRACSHVRTPRPARRPSRPNHAAPRDAPHRTPCTPVRPVESAGSPARSPAGTARCPRSARGGGRVGRGSVRAQADRGRGGGGGGDPAVLRAGGEACAPPPIPSSSRDPGHAPSASRAATIVPAPPLSSLRASRSASAG